MGSGNSVNGETHWPEEVLIGQLQQLVCVPGKIIGQWGTFNSPVATVSSVFPFGRHLLRKLVGQSLQYLSSVKHKQIKNNNRSCGSGAGGVEDCKGFPPPSAPTTNAASPRVPLGSLVSNTPTATPSRRTLTEDVGSPGAIDKVGGDGRKDERSPVIRGETTAASGAKSAARAQPMSALSGFMLMSVLLQ